VVKPILQALVLAERVYEDKSTGTKIICGVFNKLILRQKGKSSSEEKQVSKSSATLVRQVGSPTAYINLTGLHGQTPLELRYINLKTQEVLFRVELSVSCDDPLKSIEIILPLPMLPTPYPGVYALELLWNDELLGSSRITAELLPFDQKE